MTVDYACGTINRIGLDSASTPIARLRLLYFSYPAFVVIARTPPPIYRFSMKARTVGDCSSAVRKGIAESCRGEVQRSCVRWGIDDFTTRLTRVTARANRRVAEPGTGQAPGSPYLSERVRDGFMRRYPWAG